VEIGQTIPAKIVKSSGQHKVTRSNYIHDKDEEHTINTESQSWRN
jgi:hypothetical protein